MKNFSKQATLFLLTVTLCFCVSAQSAKGSETLSAGIHSIAMSPVLSLEGKPLDASAALGTGGSFLIVGSAQTAVDFVTFTIKNTVNGSQYMVRVSTKVAQGASVAVGTSVRVVAESTGYALTASGKLLAFIPNAVGQMLLHQSQVK